MTTNENLGERVIRLEGVCEHLATKADLANVKAELRAEIAGTNAKTDWLTAEMARRETRMFLRMGVLVVASVTAAVGFSRLLG